MQGHAWAPLAAALLQAAQAQHGDDGSALHRLVKQATRARGLTLPPSLQQAAQALADALLYCALWASRPLLLEPVGPVVPVPSTLIDQAGCTLVQLCPQLQQVGGVADEKNTCLVYVCTCVQIPCPLSSLCMMCNTLS